MSDLEVQHVYKVYRNGAFLGILPKPINDFYYSQDINTSGTQLTIEIPQTLDTSPEDVEPLETEAGEIITTENEIPITTEHATEIAGTKDSGLLIANGNDIEVWEYSKWHPNGIRVFTGYQSKMRARVGEEADNIELTVISYGKDLDDYVFGNEDSELKLSQTTIGTNIGVARSDQLNGEFGVLGQSFIPADTFPLTKIILRVGCGNTQSGIYPSSAIITVKLYSGNPLSANTLLASTSVQITNVTPAVQEIEFGFSNAVQVTMGQNYYFDVTANDHVAVDTNLTGVDGYANGRIYFAAPGTTLNTQGAADVDLYFKIYSGTLLTNAVFDDYDPSDMIKDGIDGYRTQGGIVSYTGSSIEDTGYSLDYEFITATVLEIVKKGRELAPANWYWYVDVATQVLNFKETLSTATHHFLLGKHLTGFDFEASIEEIKNVVYFTGGPTAGTNLLKQYTSTSSLAVNRRGMERLSDNRILAANEPSAAALSDSFMDENSSELFSATPLVIDGDTYDLTTINLGDTVKVGNFGNFLDDIVFQISSIDRYAKEARLTLGRLPFKSSAYVDELKRKLENEQTLDNPDTPS